MSDNGVRIDKWIWAARFFKTRGLATEMVNGGHVQLNGERVKPSRTVVCGDELTILREHQRYVVTVTALAEKRGSAAVARTLYEEHELGPVNTNFDGVDSAIFSVLQGFVCVACLLHTSAQ